MELNKDTILKYSAGQDQFYMVILEVQYSPKGPIYEVQTCTSTGDQRYNRREIPNSVMEKNMSLGKVKIHKN